MTAGWLPETTAQDRKATEYQDWVVTCAAGNRCFATFQTQGLKILIGRSRNTNAIRATMFVSGDAVQGSPVSVWLNSGLTIELIVSVCKEQYCEAGVAEDMTETVLSAFKRAETGVAAYAVKDRILMVPISLRGSSAAIRAVGG